MIIGIPKEIKNHEYRVGATPAGVREMVRAGHNVIIQKDSGLKIDYTNKEYQKAGADIASSIEEVYSKSDIILKVKEPQKNECQLIKEDQIIFSYLHLAAEYELTEMLIKSNCIAIAFETVNSPNGTLPLLSPMSEIAGKLSIQAGARSLEKINKGRGVLLGGVPGVLPAKVVIIGGGVAGTNAAKIALGMGSEVTILDKSLDKLRYLSDIFGARIKTLYASQNNIENSVIEADLVIGAVLVVGASTPKLVGKDLAKKMKPGAAMVDISIDQGGCFENSRPTTHSSPIYVVDDIVYYCVTNMPGSVARTSTQALENATLPFTLAIANNGYFKALREDKHLRSGLNVYKGNITHKAVADALNFNFYNINQVLDL